MLACIERRVDIQAAGIGFIAILGIDQLARHFCNIVCIDSATAAGVAQLQRFFACNAGLLSSNESVFLHAFNDVQLADAGAFRVADGVVGRRCFRQAGQHRCFCHSHVFQWLAKIHLTGCCEAIGAMTQEDLVHIDLKNFLLGQKVLQFEREKHFIDLAGVGLFRGQVHIPCDLHGDG